MYSNTKYYYFWNEQGIRKYANLPISQKKGCGRLEFAISPEYLSIRMNYCLPLSNSIVNMLLFPWKSSIVYHAGSCSTGKAIRSRDSSRPTQACSWFVFGPGQKKATGDVPVLTHRALAAAAQVQRPARAPCCPNQGSSCITPKLLKPVMAANPSHGPQHLRHSQMQILNHTKRLISDTI